MFIFWVVLWSLLNYFVNYFLLSLSETLRNYFSQYGEVVDCVIMKDKTTNQSRGFGFVKFKDPNCVRTVLETKPHNLDGRNVSILNQRRRWSRKIDRVIDFFLFEPCGKTVFFILQVWVFKVIQGAVVFFFFFTEPFFHSKHKQVSMSKTHICLPNKIYLLKVKSAKVAVKYKFLGTENGWMDKHEIELMWWWLQLDVWGRPVYCTGWYREGPLKVPFVERCSLYVMSDWPKAMYSQRNATRKVSNEGGLGKRTWILHFPT